MIYRFILGVGVLSLFIAVSAQSQTPTWSFKAEHIEACSCDLFCPCYFSPIPDKEFCKFNIAIRVKQGQYGDTKLDGLKLWMSGDFGGNFENNETNMVQFAFEPSATHEQVDGLLVILSYIYPFHWKRIVGTERTTIEWKKENDKAHAKRGDGKGEVTLTFVKGSDGKTPVVVNNLTYFGAKKNDGFNLARAKHSAKVGSSPFVFESSNGFYIEVESSGNVE